MQSAVVALMSSLSAVVQRNFMSLVVANLAATESKSIATVPATHGHARQKNCLGVGHAFGSGLGSMFELSTSALILPSSAMYQPPAHTPQATRGAMTSLRGSACRARECRAREVQPRGAAQG